MKLLKVAAGLLALSPMLMADLTVDQKVADFMNLAGLYAKNYAPYDLKRTLYGFDLFNVQPWIDQIKASKTDVDFYDICVKYVASLKDSHDEYTILSNYDAWLHFDGDIYEGNYIIDYIDRTYLPKAKYSFTTGDQLISVDGVPVADLLKKFEPYAVNGSSSPVSRARLSAGTITERYQGWNPRAAEIGKDAVIVVRHQATGLDDTYTVTWDVIGTPLTTAGIVPTPKAKRSSDASADSSRASIENTRPMLDRHRGMETAGERHRPRARYFSAPGPEVTPDPPSPDYMKPLEALQQFSAVAGPTGFGTSSGLSPFGQQLPVFVDALPANFRLRLGASSSDQFLSGTFALANKKNIGFIRIPTMSPPNTTTALNQFANEVLYFQANTDGLVIDVMNNGGGSICYTQTLVSMLIPAGFRAAGEELRPTLQWRSSFGSALANAKSSKAPQYVIDLYQLYFDVINGALTQNRANTGYLPLCSYGLEATAVTDTRGNVILYSKPILVVTDNFTLSAGELFTMFLQDNQRATVMGMQTDGGGGNVVSYTNVGAYSEGSTRMTQGLVPRLRPYAAPGFPAIPYIDGVGITPDIPLDYMTISNLNSGGVDFFNAVTDQITKMVQ